MKRIHRLIYLLSTGFFLIPGVLGLLGQTRFSLRPIVVQSDLIVVGEVLNVESKWSDGKGSMIFTYVTVAVEEYLKGSSDSNDIVIRYPGGEIKEDNIGLLVTGGGPSFAPGEKVILILRQLADKHHYGVVDPLHGKFLIDARGNVSGFARSKQAFIDMIKSLVISENK